MTYINKPAFTHLATRGNTSAYFTHVPASNFTLRLRLQWRQAETDTIRRQFYVMSFGLRKVNDAVARYVRQSSVITSPAYLDADFSRGKPRCDSDRHSLRPSEADNRGLIEHNAPNQRYMMISWYFRGGALLQLEASPLGAVHCSKCWKSRRSHFFFKIIIIIIFILITFYRSWVPCCLCRR